MEEIKNSLNSYLITIGMNGATHDEELFINQLLDYLDDNDKQIVKNYYGLLGEPRLYLNQIAKKNDTTVQETEDNFENCKRIMANTKEWQSYYWKTHDINTEISYSKGGCITLFSIIIFFIFGILGIIVAIWRIPITTDGIELLKLIAVAVASPFMVGLSIYGCTFLKTLTIDNEGFTVRYYFWPFKTFRHKFTDYDGFYLARRYKKPTVMPEQRRLLLVRNNWLRIAIRLNLYENESIVFQGFLDRMNYLGAYNGGMEIPYLTRIKSKSATFPRHSLG